MRPWRRASSRTAPTWEQQQPPSTSGRAGSSRPVAAICASSVSSATTAASGHGSSSRAASAIASPPEPHARGTRSSPAANSRPHEWHWYSEPTATAVSVRQSGHRARSALTRAPLEHDRSEAARACRRVRRGAAAPVSLCASTPRPTLRRPLRQKRPNASASSAAPMPRPRQSRAVKSRDTQPTPSRSGRQTVPATISSPARTTVQSAGVEGVVLEVLRARTSSNDSGAWFQ